MSKTSEKRHWDEFWEGSGGVGEVYDNEARVTRHFSSVRAFAGMKVLEVGAGTGRDGILMSRMGAEVVSLDYSIPSLRMIGGQIDDDDSVYLCCGDAFSLPFEDGVFDLVFHQGLLEHFRNPDDMIAEHHRVIKPGGYILVDVPQRWHYYTAAKHLLIAAGRWFAGWETEYSPRELEKMLERHSFEIVETYGEWLNPPIWYRMLRKALSGAGIRLPMYPGFFKWLRKTLYGFRERLLRSRPGLYSSVVIGTIARKARH